MSLMQEVIDVDLFAIATNGEPPTFERHSYFGGKTDGRIKAQKRR
jgi:hypothetical protein